MAPSVFVLTVFDCTSKFASCLYRKGAGTTTLNYFTVRDTVTHRICHVLTFVLMTQNWGWRSLYKARNMISVSSLLSLRSLDFSGRRVMLYLLFTPFCFRDINWKKGEEIDGSETHNLYAPGAGLWTSPLSHPSLYSRWVNLQKLPFEGNFPISELCDKSVETLSSNSGNFGEQNNPHPFPFPPFKVVVVVSYR